MTGTILLLPTFGSISIITPTFISLTWHHIQFSRTPCFSFTGLGEQAILMHHIHYPTILTVSSTEFASAFRSFRHFLRLLEVFSFIHHLSAPPTLFRRLLGKGSESFGVRQSQSQSSTSSSNCHRLSRGFGKFPRSYILGELEDWGLRREVLFCWWTGKVDYRPLAEGYPLHLRHSL
ncbi:hypothetical protein BKA64DRAFT_689725 [Cadophora sp. MPI-SDFR-AT-0126]|nr:hypothetical protein BKA64DRAFT_689725 [Leotiomycetes sp. MPI-SDFR-AT-0126]